MLKKVFISDCEGPISKNDNAFELTSHYVPEGNKLFTIISKYDDVLFDVLKRPNYTAGYTLKLILPFLKAYGATDQKMQQFSLKNLILISNIKETLQYLRTTSEVFIISTSYEHYIKALCYAINFPYKNTFCTRLNIDKYNINESESNQLKKFATEISKMPTIKIPAKAKAIKDFPEKHQKTIRRLDQIFWENILDMDSGILFKTITPMGGREKAEAIKQVAEQLNISLKQIVYVGDSITDVEAFKLIKQNDGLTISFNGNQYAINNSEIAVLSENSIITSIIADLFFRSGKQNTIDLIKRWDKKGLKESIMNHSMSEHLLQLPSAKLPKIKIITDENKKTLSKESSEFRKKVRGELIGRLG
jgi:energy-converting hydrogenase A subunit R